MRSGERKHEMIEGREAASRFRDAMKAILTVPKSAMPARTAKTKPKRKAR